MTPDIPPASRKRAARPAAVVVVDDAPASAGSASAAAATAVAPAVVVVEDPRGSTAVDPAVVAAVADTAARGVLGVHDLGSAAARAADAARGPSNPPRRPRGVSVEVDDARVLVSLTVVAEYPVPLDVMAEEVRSAVTAAVAALVGLRVTRVDVTVADLVEPAAAEDAPATTA